MKRILLTFLIYFSLVASASGLQIVKLPLAGDLIDQKGTLAAGEIKRVSGATKINSGVMSTVRGNRTNLILHSADQSDAAWVVNDATKDGSELVSFTAQNGYIRQSVVTVETGYYYISCYIKNIDGNTALHLYHQDSATGNSTAKTVTSSSVRYSVLVQGKAGGGNVIFGLQDQNAAGHGQAEVTKWQVEKLEGPAAPPGVELISDVNNRTFAAASDWTNNDIAAYDEADDMTVTANAADQYCTLAAAEAPMTGYQAYLLEFDVANIVSTWTISDFDAGYTIGTISANGTDQQIVFSYADASSGGIRITSVANDSSMDFDNVSLKEVTFPGPLEPGTYIATAGATATIPAEARFEDGWLLMEPEGTNHCLYSRDLSNAAWVKTNCTGTKNQIGLDGTASTASLLTASGANATALQTITLASTAKTFSVYIKRLVGTGAISITDNNGVNYTACASLSSTAFTKYEITRTQADPVIGFRIATNADAIIVDCNQLEETAFSTSPIHTTTSPVTRTTEAGSTADNGVSWTITQPLKNILDDAEPGGGATDSEGTLLFDVKWGCDESVIGATACGFVSVRDSIYSIAHFYNVAGIRMVDGVNISALIAPAFSASDIMYYTSRWGDVDGNADDISVGLQEEGGAWAFVAIPDSYDGEFTLGTDLRLCFGSFYPMHIRNLRFYDEAFTQAEIAAGVDKNVLLWMLLLEFP